MNQSTRLAALERRRPGAYHVLGEQRNDGPITYTVCPRHPDEEARTMTKAEFEAFAATRPIISVQIVNLRPRLPYGADDEDGEFL